jgi:hypothetical protein
MESGGESVAESKSKPPTSIVKVPPGNDKIKSRISNSKKTKASAEIHYFTVHHFNYPPLPTVGDMEVTVMEGAARQAYVSLWWKWSDENYFWARLYDGEGWQPVSATGEKTVIAFPGTVFWLQIYNVDGTFAGEQRSTTFNPPSTLGKKNVSTR